MDRSKPAKTSKKSPKVARPALLAGGNPQIAKADGDAPVQAYIAAMPGWKSYIKVAFFCGTSLRPVPPGGKGKDARWIDIREDDLDEAQMASWVKQAAVLPGWVPGRPS